MAAFLTFFGPNDVAQIKAMDPSGMEVARFMVGKGDKKSSFNISRLVAPGAAPIPICTTIHNSSLSSTTTFQVHNQEVKFESTTEGMGTTVYKLKTPAGKMKFRTPSGSFSGDKFELVDEGKQVIAKAHTKEMRLDVFVPADEVMLDFLLAGWVALVKKKNADSSGVEAAFELMGALGGGGG